MLKVTQHFGKHCSYHLQGECVFVGCFWKPCIEQVVGYEWELTKQIGGVEERVAIQSVTSTWLSKDVD
jgi:hypothetical protein